MAHQSENSIGLKLKRHRICCPEDLARKGARKPSVWLFVLPYNPLESEVCVSEEWYNAFKAFAKNIHEQTVVSVLTSPKLAAATWLEIENDLRFKLWVTVKLTSPYEESGKLPCHHAVLLILTKYGNSLKHRKTRIGYTYCPACDKTTKDYGGKKHTYHDYGTLMSDVWRDISCDPAEYPKEVVRRLRDLFGLEHYTTLHSIDLRETIVSNHIRCSPGRVAHEHLDESVRLHKGHTLLNGDCIELLRGIPSNSIDFCFADPPYNLRKKYDNWDDTLEVKEYFEWCDRWLYELARVLKPRRTLAVLNIPLWAIRHFSYMRTVLTFQNWIVWEGLGLPVRMIMPANYAILCFSKGEARELAMTNYEAMPPPDKKELCSLKEFYCIRASCVRERKLLDGKDRTRITDLWWDIHRLKHNSRRADHPCQLPPSLMRRLIALFTYPNECVLDPFNGVGTTTLAAEELNRFFIGMELSKTYHLIAEKRHSELRRGLDPFRKTMCTPKAKNSPIPRLKKQRYFVSKKELQLEVKKIAAKIGKIPNREEVEHLSKYPISYYDDYFISWGEVCAAARTTGMTEIRGCKPCQKSDAQLSLFEL